MDLKIKHAVIHIGSDGVTNITTNPSEPEAAFTQHDMDTQFGLGFNAAVAELAINWNDGGPERVHQFFKMHPAVDADSLRDFTQAVSGDPHHNEPEGTGEDWEADPSEAALGLVADAEQKLLTRYAPDVCGAFTGDGKRVDSSGEPEVEAEEVAPEDAVIHGTYTIDAVELAGIRQAEYERGKLEGQTLPREISEDVFQVKMAEALETMESANDLSRVAWRLEFVRRVLRSLNVVVR